MNKLDFPDYLTNYFSIYLPGQLGASSNTIKSYRDTFSLLLRYYRDELKQKPEKITFNELGKRQINNFLKWLEENRGSSISTRNQRLAAIKAFANYVMLESPEHISVCKELLSIPSKKVPKKPLNYLSIEEIKSILAQPDTKTKYGLRDSALLTLLYDSGSRVQEIVDLKVVDINLNSPAILKLTGKGGKSRIIPIMPDVAKIISIYLNQYNCATNTTNINNHLFSNKKGTKLSRFGIAYIVDKYVKQAQKFQLTLSTKKVTPHVFRHSKAMHLLQANVNIIYIRDLLGHASVQTTEIYAKADSKAKRKALEKARKKISSDKTYSKEKEDELLKWLKDHI